MGSCRVAKVPGRRALKTDLQHKPRPQLDTGPGWAGNSVSDQCSPRFKMSCTRVIDTILPADEPLARRAKETRANPAAEAQRQASSLLRLASGVAGFCTTAAPHCLGCQVLPAETQVCLMQASLSVCTRQLSVLTKQAVAGALSG